LPRGFHSRVCLIHRGPIRSNANGACRGHLDHCRPTGESDFSTTSVLTDVLSRVITLWSGDVVIDLADAEFIDSSTVGVLAAAQQSLDRQQRELTFRSPSRLAARVLQVFGLSDLIEAGGAQG
jgi:anti-anti-sigma factor